MIFDINVINDDDEVIFSCDSVSREMFNKYFIESCQVHSDGSYFMQFNDYKHAMLRIYEDIS